MIYEVTLEDGALFSLFSPYHEHDEDVEEGEGDDGVDGASEAVGGAEDEHGGVGQDWGRRVGQLLLLVGRQGGLPGRFLLSFAPLFRFASVI